jgi:tRNA-2-methylthio-N6-dimethylallyladenosine synthase
MKHLSSDSISSNKIFIKTFGCQMNEYDSLRILQSLKTAGYTSASSYDDASVILLNTCSVREKAEVKVYGELGRLKQLKKRNPHLIIGIGGCVAQQEGKNLLQKYPQLDLVFGTHAIPKVSQLLSRIKDSRKKIVYTEMNGAEIYPADFYIPEKNQLTAFVSIMQGCENYCSYCIVPFVRGPERSREPAAIVSEVARLAERGVKEVTLLGQNVNSFGKTLTPPQNFPELLHAVNKINGLERVRFVTSNPKDLSPQLIQAFKNLDKLCEHIHLPLQSGSDRILERMNRTYTATEYLNKVAALRAAVPDISITSDMIVGFPGESEEDFQATLDVVGSVGFDDLFFFRYSDRKGTAASQLPEKVPYETMIERLETLKEKQQHISIKKNQKLIGQTLPVLFESRSKRSPEHLAGRTRTNKVVNCKAPADIMGTTSLVKIERAHIHSLSGKLV